MSSHHSFELLEEVSTLLFFFANRASASFLEGSSSFEVTDATFLNTSRDYVSRDINITVHNHRKLELVFTLP